MRQASLRSTTAAGITSVMLPLLFLAASLPCVLAVEYGPVAGQLQEQISFGLWALCMFTLSWQAKLDVHLDRRALHLAAMLGLLAVLALVQCAVVLQVPHRGLISFFYLISAAGVLITGALAAGVIGVPAIRWLLAGVLTAGLINAVVAAAQVAVPWRADDIWIAQGFAAGRANGNMRQPNQLAVLLAMSLVALWALQSSWPSRLRRTTMAHALAAPLLLGIVLSASRFGIACALLIIVHAIVVPWTPRVRALAFGALLMLTALWLGASSLPIGQGHGLVITDRLLHESASGSRWPLWHASLQLLQAHPWTGVGWGEFNRGWMLTPKVLATTHSFSNAHNLPLHWAVELGLPLALVCCAVVVRCGWLLWSRIPLCATDAPLTTAVALIATILLLYSLVEFPLWYSRLLFPLCFLVGWAGGRIGGVRIRLPAWKAITALVLMAAALAHADYRSTAALRDVRGLTAEQLEDRVALGRRSILYASTAFRATALSMHHDELASAAVLYAGQDYLDTKLMAIWAEAMDAAGDHARAQYLMNRVAELGGQTASGGCSKAPGGAGACLARTDQLRMDDFR